MPTGGTETPVVKHPPETPVTKTIGAVFQSKGLWAWFSDRITNYFDGQSEKGQDYSTAYGTPVGVPVGGKIVRVVHNNNAINDVVELQASDGSVWLYQHITASVKVGNVLGVGDVIGTENGLPVDQYSTGPHIEVRYCPPGQWRLTTDSWDEPWVNPRSIFAALAGQAAGTVGSGFTGVLSVGGAASMLGQLSQNVHIAPDATVGIFFTALDTALELRNPFNVSIDTTSTDFMIPLLNIDTGVPNPASDVRAVFEGGEEVLTNVVNDLSAAIVRAAFIAIGVVIIMTIGYQYIQPAVKSGVDKIGGAQGVAQIAGAFA